MASLLSQIKNRPERRLTCGFSKSHMEEPKEKWSG